MNDKTYKLNDRELQVEYVDISSLLPLPDNARKWTEEVKKQVKESIRRFGMPQPLLVNSAPERKNIIISGNLRWTIAKELGFKTIAVIFVSVPDVEKERELSVRLNKNQAEFDYKLLANFGEAFLADLGFSSEELDDIFPSPEVPEKFDLQKELQKLKIDQVIIKKGDVYEIAGCRAMCGDSTIDTDILKLMDGEKADMCFTDEPYLLDYLHGKKRSGKATEGFGYKRDRHYLGTESLPDDFMTLWMSNINKVAKEDFSIISFEAWKNLPLMWAEMQRYWKIRNLIIWHLPNRVQGFAAKYKLFNKFDIALLGTSGKVELNEAEEPDELLENEYQTALLATAGKPHWESYEKGKKYCPTDFVEFVANDEKNSGQGIIFGTKPIQILLPYIKILTQRGDLIIEPFGGSFSTAVAAIKLKRRCFIMGKSPVYMTVGLKRLENLVGEKARKV